MNTKPNNAWRSNGKWIFPGLAGILIIALLAAGLMGGDPAQYSLTARGYSPSPESVEAGRYLAAAGGCLSCHSTRQGPPWAGGRRFQTSFGIIYSTNITPDRTSGIGDWTAADFRRAMKEGIDRDGDHLYPVFPYNYFTRLSFDDIDALFAFLQTLEPVSYAPPENDVQFPFGWRGSLGLWNTLYLDTEAFEGVAAKSEQWNRGAYLVEALGHCGACHTPRGLLGAPVAGEALSGATYIDEVARDRYRPWTAVNLTPSPSGLGSWTAEDIRAYLQTGHNARAGTFGPMNEVIVNSTSTLSDRDIRAMAAYLKSLPEIDHSEHQDLTPAERSDGQRLYGIHCGTCHLPTGAGDATTGTPMVGNPIVLAPDPASLINAILYGAEVPLPAPEGAWKSMESFGQRLDDQEVAAITNYLRTSWGNMAGKVTVEQVQAQR